MGNCWGSQSSSSPTGQANNLNAKRSKREEAWAATGSVSLRDSNLKEIPTSVLALGPAAKTLDATHNKIVGVPNRIKDLANLRNLMLAHNGLTALNPHISFLTNLKVLNLEHNKLQELPAEIGFLVNLERLVLSHNMLSDIPAEIGSLRRMTRLGIASNKLTRLPTELGSCYALEELDASDNYLTAVPETLRKLKKVRAINLDRNRISAIPPDILRGCAMLQTLSLHLNPITPEDLQATKGWEAFEERRKSKHDKQLSGGVVVDMDDGIDWNARPPAK